MEQSPLEKEIEQAVYGLRLLVLAECEQQECGGGRHFHQIVLTSEQFKKVSDVVFTSTGPPDKDGYEEGVLRLTEETVGYEPFEGMLDFYE